VKKTISIFLLLAFLLAGRAASAERPNILWITCEDISPYLGCYGCPEAYTPNLDQLASQGVRYTHAYANAPVCAVARSTLLTGMYATTIGTHQMRCRVQLPPMIPAYPRILRQAGYYCTNNRKKDYNSNYENDPSLWDESSGKAHYQNRRAGQPFFAVFNITVTHESQLSPERIKGYVARQQIPSRPRIDPQQIELPPYHPDLPAVRQDWARYDDLITLMDRMVGQRLRELEESGLAEETIVLFCSDHGGMLARSKRYIYNVGTRVPLIIRFPRKWQHLAPAPPGSAVDRLVSFVDIPKTLLSICGAPVPRLMQGRIFLGPEAEPARAVTDGRWYYIRNFMPHRPRGYDSWYGYQVQANWRAWRAHFEAGRCNAVQSQFYRPKPAVEFFDLQADPWQVTNLADRPEHQQRIRQMEQELDRWMIATRDVGLVPEPLFYDLVGPDKPFKTLYEFAQSEQYPVERLLQVAKTASLGERRRVDEYLVRTEQSRVQDALKRMMTGDPLAGNRIMAAQALARCGGADAAFDVLRKEALEATNGYVFLFALNALQYGHVDDRLSREDWEAFAARKAPAGTGMDVMGFGYAQRIVTDALQLWPRRRRVD